MKIGCINKIAFCRLMDALMDYSDGINSLEKALKTSIADSFLVDFLDTSIISLTDAFFTVDELEANLDPHKVHHLNFDCDETFRWDWETVNDMIFYYCNAGNFGRATSMVRDMLMIRDTEGILLERYHTRNSSELYDAIMTFLCRDDSEGSMWSYNVNCSSVNRG